MDRYRRRARKENPWQTAWRRQPPATLEAAGKSCGDKSCGDAAAPRLPTATKSWPGSEDSFSRATLGTERLDRVTKVPVPGGDTRQRHAPRKAGLPARWSGPEAG